MWIRRLAAVALALPVLSLLGAGCSHKVLSTDVGADSVQPDLVCNAQVASDVRIRGEGFSPMASKVLQEPATLILPSVTLARTQDITGAAGGGMKLTVSGDPAENQADHLSWQSQKQVTLRVDEALGLEQGLYDVTVTNPDGEKKGDLQAALAVVDPPSIVALKPASLCAAQADQTLIIEGASFLKLGAEFPSVRIRPEGGGAETTVAVQAVDGCVAVPGRSPAAELCTSATVTIRRAELTPGTYVITITNPGDPETAPGCSSSETIVLHVNPPPRVDLVAPGHLCSGGGEVVLQGEFFQPGASVEVRCPGALGPALSERTEVSADGRTLTATMGPGTVGGEECDVVVINPDGCEDEPLPHDKITGTEGPIVFYVDPIVAYNGINTRLTIYVTAILGAFSVELEDANGARTPLASSVFGATTNRVQALVPEGQAPGDYTVVVTDDSGCTGRFASLTVKSELTLTVTAIEPGFGQSGENIPVVITGAGFTQTPRAFLNPQSGAATEPAVQLQGLSFINATELSAHVPAATPQGVYDLVVVNPSGEVGFLQGAYRSLGTSPPVITGVSPQTIVRGAGQLVTITGTGLAGGTVSTECRAITGTDVTEPTLGAQSCTDTSCSVTMDATAVPNGAVCVITVTSADGTTFGRFSALGVTEPAVNLLSPIAGIPMTVGRRALASAAVRANSVSRFLYAAGGDGGQALAATPLASTEFINVNLFGQMEPAGWQPNRASLATGRAFMGTATIGRYFYVFGGTNGAQALASGERSMLLAPEEAPRLADVDLCLGGGTRPCFAVTGVGGGLAEGDYSYRVSAVIGAADPVNLGGETLASDPIILKLRPVAGRNIVVQLSWTAPADKLGADLSGVTGYRIYRTAAGGAPGQDELLLAEVTGATTLTFVDDGTRTLGTQAPLPVGSTSAWQALPAMGTARNAPAGVAGVHPSDPGTWYVYALQGEGLRTYEFLRVTLSPNDRQAVGSGWVEGAQQASVPRHEFGAWVATASNSPVITGSDTFVFLGSGRSGAGTTGVVEAGRIAAGGDLGVLSTAPANVGAARSGYFACVVSDQLLAFGGLSAGTVLNDGISGQMVTPMPEVANWNNQGVDMRLQSPRNLLGGAVESAFIFLIGGEATPGGVALSSTESLAF